MPAAGSARANEADRLIPKEGMAYIHLQNVSVNISKGQLPAAEEHMDRVCAARPHPLLCVIAWALVVQRCGCTPSPPLP